MGIYRQARKTFRRGCYALSGLKAQILTGRRRPLVVFIHVPKTGGTSINSYFKEFVGSKRSGLALFYDESFADNADLFARKARNARFVTGHMPWTVFESFRSENTYAFTFLRDPYDRLRSLYHHAVNLPPSVRDDEDMRLVKNMSLKEFLASRHPVVRLAADNFLARQFTGALKLKELPETQEDRQRLAAAAIRNLSTLNLIGFNEDFDSAFSEIAQVAGLPPPPRGRRVNATADLVAAGRDRTAASRALDDETRELAQPLVEADLIVYEHFRNLRG